MVKAPDGSLIGLTQDAGSSSSASRFESSSSRLSVRRASTDGAAARVLLGCGRCPRWPLSAERVLFPEDGITKGDLFSYYGAVAGAIVPHLKHRLVHDEAVPARDHAGGLLPRSRRQRDCRMDPDAAVHDSPARRRRAARRFRARQLARRAALDGAAELHSTSKNEPGTRASTSRHVPTTSSSTSIRPTARSRTRSRSRTSSRTRSSSSSSARVREDERRVGHPRARADHPPVGATTRRTSLPG